MLKQSGFGKLVSEGLIVCFLFLGPGVVSAGAGDRTATDSSSQDQFLLAQADKKKAKELKLRPPELGSPEIEKHIYRGQRFEERLLELGTDEKFEILERSLIKSQIKSFIPPLLTPALTGHAFVLPPGLTQVALGFTFAQVYGDDFFKDGEIDSIHIQNTVRRRFLTASFRYGFDLDQKFLHSFTAILNIPYQISVTRGPVQLPDIGGTGGAKSVFNGGTSEGIGDISLFIKKKLTDQANFPVGLAVAAGVYFPTGSNEEKVGTDGTIRVLNGDGTLFANPIFGRFTDDGELPAGLQPGTGEFSYQFGVFLTRQFVPGDMPDFLAGTKFDRAAVHMGVVYRINQENEDGTDRGDRATFFFAGVLPVYKDFVSLQFQSITFWQENDSYTGFFKFPNTAGLPPAPPGAPRPDFRGGLSSYVGPSIIFSPDPIIRITGSALFRVLEPALGPSPSLIVNIGTSFIF